MSYRPDGWNAGNDGSGSGLDADKLDNLSSADFALVAHGHDLNALDDVNITVLNTGDILMWDGVGLEWEEHTPAWASTTVANSWDETQTFNAAEGFEIGVALDAYLSSATIVFDATGYFQINIDSDSNSSVSSFIVAHDGTGTGGTDLFTVVENGLVQVGAGGITGVLRVWSNRSGSDAPHVELRHDQAIADECWISAFYNNGSTKQGDLGWNAAGDAYFRNHESGGNMYFVSPTTIEFQTDTLILDDPSGVLEIKSTADAKIILRDDGTAAWNRIDFYDQTDRHGYLGFNTGNNFIIVNEETAGQITLETTGGGALYIDDGGTLNGRIASIKTITATATAPTGDYPYGCLHLIY